MVDGSTGGCGRVCVAVRSLSVRDEEIYIGQEACSK